MCALPTRRSGGPHSVERWGQVRARRRGAAATDLAKLHARVVTGWRPPRHRSGASQLTLRSDAQDEFSLRTEAAGRGSGPVGDTWRPDGGRVVVLFGRRARVADGGGTARAAAARAD